MFRFNFYRYFRVSVFFVFFEFFLGFFVEIFGGRGFLRILLIRVGFLVFWVFCGYRGR